MVDLSAAGTSDLSRLNSFATPSANDCCFSEADDRSRRIAAVARRDRERLNWADSAGWPNGRKRAERRRSCGTPDLRPKHAFIEAPGPIAKGGKRVLVEASPRPSER